MSRRWLGPSSDRHNRRLHRLRPAMGTDVNDLGRSTDGSPPAGRLQRRTPVPQAGAARGCLATRRLASTDSTRQTRPHRFVSSSARQPVSPSVRRAGDEHRSAWSHPSSASQQNLRCGGSRSLDARTRRPSNSGLGQTAAALAASGHCLLRAGSSRSPRWARRCPIIPLRAVPSPRSETASGQDGGRPLPGPT